MSAHSEAMGGCLSKTAALASQLVKDDGNREENGSIMDGLPVS